MYYNGYDGLSTFESMKRLKDEFGVDKVIICTQEYYMYRVIYNARKMGIEAYGYPAKIDYANQLQRDIRKRLHGLKTLYWYCLQLNCFV